MRSRASKRYPASSIARAAAMRAQLTTVLEGISDAFVTIDRDWRYTYISDQAQQMLGQRGDLLGHGVWDLFPEARSSTASMQLQRAMADQTMVSFEDFNPVLNRWYENRAYPTANGIAVFFTDITARKQAEQALRASEERFRVVQQSTPDGFMVFESVREGGAIVDFRWVYTNPAAEQIVGRSAQELVGRRLLEEMPGNRDEGLFDAYLHVVETGATWQREFAYQHDGLDKWFRTTATRTGDGFAVTFEDVTERKRAEAERERLAEQRQLALDAAKLGWWHYDPVSQVSWWDDRYKAIFGIAESRNPIDEVMARLHPDDVSAVWVAVEASLDPLNSVPYAVEYRIRRPDGTIRWIEAYGLPSFEEANGTRRATSFVGTVADITERKVAEDQLRASEAHFRQLAESLPQFAWVSKASGGLEYINAQWAAYSGLSPDQTNNSASLASIFHPDDAPHVLAQRLQAHASGAAYEVKARLRRTDGVYRWFLIRSVPLKDESGRVIKWFGTSTDIHVQEQSGRDAQFLADLAEHIRLAESADALPAAVVRLLGQHLDVARCYFADIDAAQEHWRIRSEYRTALPALAGNYRISDYPPEGVQAMREGHTRIVEDTETDPRATPAYIQIYASLGVRAYIIVPFLRDGRWVSNLVVAADAVRQWEPREVRLLETVAERVWLAIEKLRAEQALREREERLQVLYAQEQAARREAEEANRLKDEFLATVSHELRTPLTAILGYGHLLQSRPRDAAYMERTLAKILSSARVQAQLTEDLLDVARIMTGKLHLEVQPTDVVAVIHAAIDAVRPAIDSKAIQLHTDLDPAAAAIVGDPGRLQQVVGNLLSNAVKFTPAGGVVQVRLQPTSDEVELSVSDTGQGIADSFLPHVFERFRQADSTSTRAHSGLGLGLSIVHHLVELHGGTVQAHSSGTGEGATFTVRLPRRTPRDAATPTEDGADVQVADAACPPELVGLRVLVVDDQPAITDLLDEVLSACGAVVCTTTAARDALATLQAWRPDVLVSDIAMPGEDGYWLIGQVRALAGEAGGDTPALALTAYVRADDRARVLAAGFQQYVPKPVEPAALRAAVARLVNSGAPANA